MIDREKVVKGLEYCTGNHLCSGCGYYDPDNVRCQKDLMRDALSLLTEQKSEWLEDSDPGQEYGTTWACRRCMHSIHKPFVWNPYDSGYKYCPHCGAEMKVKWE